MQSHETFEAVREKEREFNLKKRKTIQISYITKQYMLTWKDIEYPREKVSSKKLELTFIASKYKWMNKKNNRLCKQEFVI